MMIRKMLALQRPKGEIFSPDSYTKIDPNCICHHAGDLRKQKDHFFFLLKFNIYIYGEYAVVFREIRKGNYKIVIFL